MCEATDDLIDVGMAQLAAAADPARLISYSLGSCVALILYDGGVRVGGVAHVMLPSANSRPVALPGKFANLALEALLEEMEKLGASRRRIVAKLVGGATLFKLEDSSAPSMGTRIAAALREHLSHARIRLIAEDTGGDFARTVTLATGKGTVKIRTAARGEYEL